MVLLELLARPHPVTVICDNQMQQPVALQIDCYILCTCIQGVGDELDQKDFGRRDELVTGPEILDYLLPVNIGCVLLAGHARSPT